MKEIIFKNSHPYYEDILCEIGRIENCGTGNIKNWYRESKNGIYNGVIKYELYNNTNQDLIDIIEECGIEYKLNGENSIIFNKKDFFWDYELSYSKFTKKYKLRYSKENKKGSYLGAVEKEFSKPQTVVKNIIKLIKA